MLTHRKILKMEIEQLEQREAHLKEMSLSAKDLELKKKFHLELIIIQDEIKQIKEEYKLLQTPIQQLLPDIFEEKRAIPNSFLRCAIFGIVKKGKRALVKDEKIFSMSQYDISFSGEYLDQNDLELWDTLIFLAKKNMVENELRISLYELCKIMRLSDQKINRENLLIRAKRLQFGQVTIKFGKREYYGSLIDEVLLDRDGDGKLVIRYNKNLAKMFVEDNDYTLISVDIRQMLGDDQLARWLYNFYESHKNPIPFTIDFLQKLCRSETEPKDFKYKLKKALILVQKAFLAFNPKARWDYEIIGKQLIIHKNGKFNQQKLL